MNSTAVWKFEFTIADEVTVEMPMGAKVVYVDRQPRQPQDRACIWAIVEINAQPVQRTFYVRGTGRGLPNKPYIDTWQSPPFVWHLFGD